MADNIVYEYLKYPQNYGDYFNNGLISNGYTEIDTSIFTKDNIDIHFDWIHNILRDGIELPEVQSMIIKVNFSDGEWEELPLTDYWLNLVFWKMSVLVGQPISSVELFWTEELTKKYIKFYIDHVIINKFRSVLSFITISGILDDSIYKFKYMNEFAMYIGNTVCLEDTIDLMKQYKEFYDAVHCNVSGVPIGDVKKVGMDAAERQIRYIKNTDHCLRDSFISQETVNPKQFKEVQANIGPKPDGDRGIYPMVIGTSFINGGVAEPSAYLIESATGRTAQILSKNNVGVSGAFARLLDINNTDTIFNRNPDYVCNTKRMLMINIKSDTHLELYNLRYYRESKHGEVKVINSEIDKHLIGRTVLMYSPMTCDSYAKGHGICRRCYGELYWVNMDINPGKIAGEIFSSKYTQTLLSAKHLLESKMIALEWNREMLELFEINLNTISLPDNVDYSGYKMRIDPDTIDDESDDPVYCESIPSFDVVYPDGSVVNMHTSNLDSIFISGDLNNLIREKAEPDDKYITIPLEALKHLPIIFLVSLKNDELSMTLERAKSIINKSTETKNYNIDTIVEEFMDANLEGGIVVSSIHAETIISNQIRLSKNGEEVLLKPNWADENTSYVILALSNALTNNPSLTVSLEYQNIAKTLTKPLTFKKSKASFIDLFFMPKPQEYINNDDIVTDKAVIINDKETEKKDALAFFD